VVSTKTGSAEPSGGPTSISLVGMYGALVEQLACALTHSSSHCAPIVLVMSNVEPTFCKYSRDEDTGNP
jgi:hypothetical protein